MEKKKKRSKKRKLSSLLLILLLTIVMLSASTYAWFTANKNVTVSTLDVHVEATSGLQISADGFEWKTVLSNADLTAAAGGRYSTAINQIPATLEPTSTSGHVDATTGLLKMFEGTVGEATDASGDFALTAVNAAAEANGTVGKFIAFDIFLKTEANAQLYLTTDSNVIPKALTSDKGLKNAARVAFVIQGQTTSDDTLPNIQALQATDDTGVRIWEPNYDVHTTFAVTAALTNYNITTTVGPNVARVPYSGVLAPLSDIKLINTTAAANPTYFESITPNILTKATETDYKTAFAINEGITKVRVYMWVEGQDVDCENNASGSDISFNIQLSTNSSAGTP